jgi:hypothetical protein
MRAYSEIDKDTSKKPIRSQLFKIGALFQNRHKSYYQSNSELFKQKKFSDYPATVIDVSSRVAK